MPNIHMSMRLQKWMTKEIQKAAFSCRTLADIDTFSNVSYLLRR